MFKIPDLKDKPFGGASSIHDEEVKAFIKSNIDIYKISDIDEFLYNYKDWLSRGNNLIGLHKYKYLAFSNGTTESFDKFYMKYAKENRRLRLWKGEYFYHQIQRRELFNRFAWIDEDELKKDDIVVVSLPFSNTGNVPNNYDKIMKTCSSLDIPVLVDMAYVSLTSTQSYNLDYTCIKTITTSLSKIFPVEHLRIGIRFQKEFSDDTLDAYSSKSVQYVNFTSLNVGNELIKNFPQNYLYNKWRYEQIKLCDKLELTPSNSVIFGLDYNNKYNEYSRGGDVNRLCFSRIWDNRVNYG